MGAMNRPQIHDNLHPHNEVSFLRVLQPTLFGGHTNNRQRVNSSRSTASCLDRPTTTRREYRRRKAKGVKDIFSVYHMRTLKTTVINPDAAGGDVTGGGGGNRGTSHSSSTSPVPTTSSSIASSPFVIGKAFIKQYYQLLTTSPEQILKFYKEDTSSLSHSLEASTRAEPVILNSQDFPHSIFGWTMGAKVTDSDQTQTNPVPPGIRFDFEHGAIDAQETINGGILLVVTGFMYLPTSPETPKAFVHTFILLNGSPPGTKKHFYVHNDVLRVMAESPVTMNDDMEEHPDKNVVTVHETFISSDVSADNLCDVEQPIQENETPALSQDPATSIHVKAAVLEASTEFVLSSSVASDNALEGAVDAADAVKGGDERRRRNKRGSRSRKSDASSPVDKVDVTETEATSLTTTLPTAPASSSTNKNGSSRSQNKTSSASAGNKPKSISSWASVVTSTPVSAPTKTGGAGSSTKGHKASHDDAVEEYKDGAEAAEFGTAQEDIGHTLIPEKSHLSEITTVKGQAGPESTAATGTSTKPAVQGRNPDATLYIKSVPEKTKEPEIRAMFEPYAVQLKKNILGITLHPGRGFCFVDFDSKDVVDAVMLEVQKLADEGKNKDGTTYKFSVNGHPLSVNRKVNENVNRGRGHGGNSGSGGASGRGQSQSNANTSNLSSQKQNQTDGAGIAGGGAGGKQKNSPRASGGNRGGGHRSTTTVGEN